ncbi:MAG: hypothetical protein PHP52_06145 [Bacteroidales bacterium]|nr:hypothetical protein [Bacteroidales bacterium]MDY0141847.1 hypothetical protein [Bacteroidales bacterium]
MKKRIVNLLIITVLTFSTFGCVMKQEIYFNKDFSGKYKYSYDFTDYVGYMHGEEGNDSLMMKNDDFAEYLNLIVGELKQIKGVSSVKYLNDADNGLVYYQFDFENIEALNKGLVFSSYMDQEPLENPPFFEKKGKKITFVRHAIPKENLDGEALDEDLESLNYMFSWELAIEFERNVKKYDVQKDTTVTVSNNKRKFLEKSNVFDIVEKETKWVFKTK